MGGKIYFIGRIERFITGKVRESKNVENMSNERGKEMWTFVTTTFYVTFIA